MMFTFDQNIKQLAAALSLVTSRPVGRACGCPAEIFGARICWTLAVGNDRTNERAGQGTCPTRVCT